MKQPPNVLCTKLSGLLPILSDITTCDKAL